MLDKYILLNCLSDYHTLQQKIYILFKKKKERLTYM